MDETRLRQIIRDVGLALNITNNCITTDDVNAKTDELSWEVDNGQEIDMINELEAALNADIFPLCDRDRTSP